MAYASSAEREQLRIQALTDELTGLFNRRHFEHSLSTVLRDERDRGGPTSVVYFDVDTFKRLTRCRFLIGRSLRKFRQPPSFSDPTRGNHAFAEVGRG